MSNGTVSVNNQMENLGFQNQPKNQSLTRKVFDTVFGKTH